MAVVFQSVLSVTTVSGNPNGSSSIDLTGLTAGDLVFGAFSLVAAGVAQFLSWSPALTVDSMGGFGGFGGGHVFYAIYNGTDATYDIDLTTTYDPADTSPSTSQITCAAVSYKGASTIDPASGTRDFRYPTSSVTPDFTLTPDTSTQMMLTAQTLPNDQASLGAVSSPFILRASSVGGLCTPNAFERALASDTPFLGPPLYPQVQLADLSGVTSAEAPTWTNTDTAYTTFEGVAIEGVGVAFYLFDVIAGVHISQRF